MNNTIAIIKNAFDIGFCNNALAKMTNKQRGAVGQFEAGTVVEQTRKSNVCFVNGIINNTDLFTPLITKVSEINKQYFGFDLNEPETIQLTEYDSAEQGEYKPHEDDADWVGLVPERFDPRGVRKLSVVIQLSDSKSYEGGELIIETINSEEKFKLNAGEIILYPSSYLHAVSQVDSGYRVVCVGWIESYVKSAEQREYLFDLDAGARGILAKYGMSDEVDLIFKSYSNLLRILGN